jgi:hypothetical protein
LTASRQKIHFVPTEQFGQEQPAFAVEVLDLFGREFHGVSSLF